MLGNIKIVSIIIIYELILKPLRLVSGDANLSVINILGYMVTLAAGIAFTMFSLHERGQLKWLDRVLGKPEERSAKLVESPNEDVSPRVPGCFRLC